MELPPRLVDEDFKMHSMLNADFGVPSGLDVDWIDTIVNLQMFHAQDQANFMGAVHYLANIRATFYSKKVLRNCRSFKDWLMITSGPVYVLVKSSWKTKQNEILTEDQLRDKICDLLKEKFQIDVSASSYPGLLVQKSKQISTKDLCSVLLELFPVVRIVMMGMQLRFDDIPDHFHRAMLPSNYPKEFDDGQNSFDLGISTTHCDRLFLLNKKGVKGWFKVEEWEQFVPNYLDNQHHGGGLTFTLQKDDSVTSLRVYSKWWHRLKTLDTSNLFVSSTTNQRFRRHLNSVIFVRDQLRKKSFSDLGGLRWEFRIVAPDLLQAKARYDARELDDFFQVRRFFPWDHIVEENFCTSIKVESIMERIDHFIQYLQALRIGGRGNDPLPSEFHVLNGDMSSMLGLTGNFTRSTADDETAWYKPQVEDQQPRFAEDDPDEVNPLDTIDRNMELAIAIRPTRDGWPAEVDEYIYGEYRPFMTKPPTKVRNRFWIDVCAYIVENLWPIREGPTGRYQNPLTPDMCRVRCSTIAKRVSAVRGNQYVAQIRVPTTATIHEVVEEEDYREEEDNHVADGLRGLGEASVYGDDIVEEDEQQQDEDEDREPEPDYIRLQLMIPPPYWSPPLTYWSPPSFDIMEEEEQQR